MPGPGGKQKQAQRTKGNVKPSSSGRAAELLAASGGGKIGYVGFQTMSDLGYVPVSAGDEVDSCVDGEFRMLLRKFSKKDTVTKLKTLQEFRELCKEKDEESLNGVLTFWPRLYSKLSMDNDRRVREATQQAFGALILPIRRSLAPHLKLVMPSWLLAQCDTYAPAASAANSVFTTVFPENKQADVLVHCKDEIFNVLKDNLLVQTVHTLCDKATPKEDAESKHQRLVTSSLGSLRLMVTMVPGSKHTTFLEPLDSILADQKFWKLAKHQSNQIRAAFYSLISSLCMGQTELCVKYSDKLCPSVLHRLDDADPMVCPSLWEAVVAVTSQIQRFWQHVNLKKAVLPQLWTVLKSGGQGSAKCVYPTMLPLLSKLPDDVITPDFHDEFFQKLLCEGQQKLTSSDVTVIINAYMECLRYVITSYITKSDVTGTRLIQTRLIPLLEKSLIDDSSVLASSPLYPQLSELLAYIRKQDPTPNWNALYGSFWNDFSQISRQNLQPTTSCRTVERLSDLLVNFKRKRREKRLKFAESISQAPDDSSVNDDSQCLELVSELCSKAFTIAKSTSSHAHIAFLSRILGVYQSPKLIADILCDQVQSDDVCKCFCEESLIPWILDLSSEKCGEDGMKGLFDLLLSVHGMASAESKELIFDCITEKLASPSVLYESMRSFQTKRREPSVEKWFQSEKLGALLVKTAQDLCTTNFGSSSVPSKSAELIAAPIRPPPPQYSVHKLHALTEDGAVVDMTSSKAGVSACVTSAGEDSMDLSVSDSVNIGAGAGTGTCASTGSGAGAGTGTGTCASTGSGASASDVSSSDSAQTSVVDVRNINTTSKAIPDTTTEESRPQSTSTAADDSVTQVTSKDTAPVLPSTCHARVAVVVVDEDKDDEDGENDELVDSMYDGAWKLLRLALTIDENFESLIHTDYVNEILRSLTAALPPIQPRHPPELPRRSVHLICDLAQHFFSNFCLFMPQAEDLLLVLFQLSFLQNVFSEKLANKIRSTWLTGVTSLTNQKGGYIHDKGFLQMAALYLKSYLRQPLTNNGIDHAVYEFAHLLDCVHDCVSDDPDHEQAIQTPVVVELVKILRHPVLFTDKSWETSVLFEGTMPLKLNLHSSHDTPLANQLRTDILTSPISSAIGYFELVTSLSGGDVGGSVMTSELLDDEYLIDFLRTIAYVRANMGCRMEAQRRSELGIAYSRLTKSFKSVTTGLDADRLLGLQKRLINRSMMEGGLYALCLGDVLSLSPDVTSLLETVHNMDWFEGKLPAIQTLSVAKTYMNKYALVSLAMRFLDDVTNLNPLESEKLPGSLSIVGGCIEALYSPREEQVCHGELNDLLLSLLNTIVQWKHKYEGIMLLECDSERPSARAPLLVEIMRVLSVVMQSTTLLEILTSEHWDFILCTLVSWLQSIGDHTHLVATVLTHQLTSYHAHKLLQYTATAMSSLLPMMEHAPPTLAQEWGEFFAGGCYRFALIVYKMVNLGRVDIDENCQGEYYTLAQDYLCRAMSEALVLCPIDVLKEAMGLQARLSDRSHLAENLQTLLNHLCPMLMNCNRSVQLTAYYLLLGIMPELSQADDGHEVEGEEKMDEVARSPPQPLMSILEESRLLLDDYLIDYSPCDTVVVQAHSEHYTYSMASLLVWKLLLSFFKAASSELRAQYAAYLKREELLTSLMEHLTHLLPEQPVQQLKNVLTRPSSSSSKMTTTRSLFSEAPCLDVGGDGTSMDIQHLSCQVFYTALEELPALIRQWLHRQTKTTACFIDKYTSKYVSPILCVQEITAVHESNVTFNNMVVKTRPAAREVAAIYTVDDVSMEIVVSLPANYPFGVVAVETGRRVGVATAQWRNWMLQMTTILNHQNGTILDGLRLWKKNIDKKFEGVEDCMICFSVIHGSNCQLPKQLCRTCKKKFHSACLYKWFNTSNNTACPLCRNLF